MFFHSVLPVLSNVRIRYKKICYSGYKKWNMYNILHCRSTSQTRCFAGSSSTWLETQKKFYFFRPQYSHFELFLFAWFNIGPAVTQAVGQFIYNWHWSLNFTSAWLYLSSFIFSVPRPPVPYDGGLSVVWHLTRFDIFAYFCRWRLTDIVQYFVFHMKNDLYLW